MACQQDSAVLFTRAAARRLCCQSRRWLNKAPPRQTQFWSDVEKERPAPVAVLKLPSMLLKSENQPTAVFAEPKVRLKGVLPFSRVEPRIASVRRWHDCLCLLGPSRQIEECHCYENCSNCRFHISECQRNPTSLSRGKLYNSSVAEIGHHGDAVTYCTGICVKCLFNKLRCSPWRAIWRDGKALRILRDQLRGECC